MHILAPVTDNCPFLNQRKGDNGRRNFFMTILLPRVCAGREDGIRDRPNTRRTRVRPSYHARQRNLKEGELFIQPSGWPSQGQCHRFDTRWRRYSSPSHKRRLVVQNHGLSSSNRPDRTEILFKGALNR